MRKQRALNSMCNMRSASDEHLNTVPIIIQTSEHRQRVFLRLIHTVSQHTAPPFIRSRAHVVALFLSLEMMRDFINVISTKCESSKDLARCSKLNVKEEGRVYTRAENTMEMHQIEIFHFIALCLYPGVYFMMSRLQVRQSSASHSKQYQGPILFDKQNQASNMLKYECFPIHSDATAI